MNPRTDSTHLYPGAVILVPEPFDVDIPIPELEYKLFPFDVDIRPDLEYKLFPETILEDEELHCNVTNIPDVDL